MRPFFSSAGRASRGSFVAWVALGLGALVLCLYVLTLDIYQAGSYPMLVGTYALMGVIVAKLRVESVRRLKDEGTSSGTGWWAVVWAAFALCVMVTTYYIIGPMPVTIGCLGVLLVVWAITFLRRGRPGKDADAASGWFDWVAGLACVVSGSILGWFVADVSNGMEQSHRRSMEWQAEHNRFSKPEPEQPMDPENAKLSNKLDTLLPENKAR